MMTATIKEHAFGDLNLDAPGRKSAQLKCGKQSLCKVVSGKITSAGIQCDVTNVETTRNPFLQVVENEIHHPVTDDER